MFHCIKIVRIRSFLGPYFPAFGLNTDQKNFEYGHFSRSVYVFISMSASKNGAFELPFFNSSSGE